MVMMARKHAKVVMVALAAFLFLGAGCSGRKSWVEKVPDLETLDEFTAESVYSIAESHAQEWQPSAYLTMVFVWMPGDSIENAPDKIIYRFATELEGDRQGTSSIDVYPKEGEFHVYTRPIAKTERPVSPLAFESAIVDSSEALRAAEAAGGRAYRESHADVSVVVSGEQDWLHGGMTWTVRYIESAPGPAGFWFTIHAQTGEVLYPR
jgi:hypothetical protein